MLIKNFFKFILLLIYTNNVSSAFYSNYTIDAKKYFEMPHLNELDDYEECMDVYQSEAKYCYVRSIIKPDHQSQLYSDIAEFSSRKKQHFRHDKLTRGICLNKCMAFIEQLDEKYANSLFQSQFNDPDEKLTLDFINFANYAEDQKAYNKIINQCINYKLTNSFNLSAYSSIEYCRKSEAMFKIDKLDITFICLLTFLILIILLSSCYDERLKKSCETPGEVPVESNDHFKKPPVLLIEKFMVSFSIYRNWYLLSAPTKNEKRDMRAISTIRIWTMVSIIYGHVSWFLTAAPINNPIWIEKHYHLMRAMIVINGGNLVQTFFFLSGFLNSTSILYYANETNMKKCTLFVRATVYRIFRFVPVLMFFVLLHATWLHKFENGPYWDKFTVYERQACRKNMWTNFLLINNYVSGEMRCMIHTWYISADFQLGVLGTVILLMILKYPKKRNLLLFGSIIMSFIIAFIHLYVNKLEPILILPPENLRNQLMGNAEYDRYFYDFHSPTHLNTGNYLIGLVIGYFYFQYKQHKHKDYFDLSGLYKALWHISYLLTFVLCFIGIFFYEYDMKIGLLSAFLGAVLKHIYGPILGILLIGIFLRYGWIIPKMFNYGMYRILARLSYSVYMVHYTIACLIIMKNKHTIEINNSMLLAFTLAVYCLSHAAALFLVVCIELPTHVIFKTIVNEILEKPKMKNVMTVTNENCVKIQIKNTNGKL